MGLDRTSLWRAAFAPAREAHSHLKPVAQAGAIDRVGAEKALDHCDRVRAMPRRLLHPNA